MSLDQAIHERWAESGELSALLPAERLTTGRAFGDKKPYATIESLVRRPALATNSGNVVKAVSLNLCIWHDNFDEGENIVECVQTVFDHAVFNLPDNSAAI